MQWNEGNFCIRKTLIGEMTPPLDDLIQMILRLKHSISVLTFLNEIQAVVQKLI